ncbi:2-phosphosulfolactate phosphatase [Actinopolymorpha alba]|uniref:2-phosphosulfolactate phosphatase n=1 Tax=Actinopolymorpha alba TaxID=533267 RepID=UPI00036E0869|nr:2-phosphosulfolactate phosphatase [Actinopolymorpha alba]
MDNVYGQSQAQVRMEWGPTGAAAVAEDADIAVVVDVLSFTTTLCVAVERGAEVFPYRWRDESAREYARSHEATLAVGRLEARQWSAGEQVSLSPHSIRAARDLKRLVLPSPNGSSISFLLAETGAQVVGACLRNRSAVATWIADKLAQDPTLVVAIVAAGERWHDGSLRPAVEDLWGAGGVLAALAQHLRVEAFSPEARTAAAAFRNVEADLGTAPLECTSGRELVEATFEADVLVAAEVDASACVPVLVDGRFRDALPPRNGVRSEIPKMDDAADIERAPELGTFQSVDDH